MISKIFTTASVAFLFISCTPRQQSNLTTIDNFAKNYELNELTVNQCGLDGSLELNKLRLDLPKDVEKFESLVSTHVDTKLDIRWHGEFSDSAKISLKETVKKIASTMPTFALEILLMKNFRIYMTDGIDLTGKKAFDVCTEKNGVLHTEGSDFHCFDISKATKSEGHLVSLVFAPSEKYSHDLKTSLHHALLRNTVQSFFIVFDAATNDKKYADNAFLKDLIDQKTRVFSTYLNEIQAKKMAIPSHLRDSQDSRIQNFFLGELVDSIHCSNASRENFANIFPSTLKAYLAGQ